MNETKKFIEYNKFLDFIEKKLDKSEKIKGMKFEDFDLNKDEFSEDLNNDPGEGCDC